MSSLSSCCALSIHSGEHKSIVDPKTILQVTSWFLIPHIHLTMFLLLCKALTWESVKVVLNLLKCPVLSPLACTYYLCHPLHEADEVGMDRQRERETPRPHPHARCRCVLLYQHDLREICNRPVHEYFTHPRRPNCFKVWRLYQKMRVSCGRCKAEIHSRNVMFETGSGKACAAKSFVFFKDLEV